VAGLLARGFALKGDTVEKITADFMAALPGIERLYRPEAG
jgi:hypothetical protein